MKTKLDLMLVLFILALTFSLNTIIATDLIEIPSDSSPVKIINSDFQTEQNTTVKDSLEVDLIYGDSDSDIALMGGDVGIGILNPDVALNVSGDIGSTSTISANDFVGDGSSLTSVSATLPTSEVFFTFLDTDSLNIVALINNGRENSDPSSFIPNSGSDSSVTMNFTGEVSVHGHISYESFDLANSDTPANAIIAIRANDTIQSQTELDYDNDETDVVNHWGQEISWAGSVVQYDNISVSSESLSQATINNDNTTARHAGWLMIQRIN